MSRPDLPGVGRVLAWLWPPEADGPGPTLYERRMIHVAVRQVDECIASNGAITAESTRLSRRWMRAYRKARSTGCPFVTYPCGSEWVRRMEQGDPT